jgi:hypothetical protein
MMFSAAALSKNDVWVVGDREGGNRVFETLAEHWNGTTWTVVPTPSPGSAGNHLYGLYAVGPDNVWTVGQQLAGGGSDRPLVELWAAAPGPWFPRRECPHPTYCWTASPPPAAARSGRLAKPTARPAGSR